jgi:phosphatidylglycerophosphatase A
MGTLAALLALPVFVVLPLWAQLSWVLLTAGVGIWLCDRAAKELGVHDHPAIVWDEFVGVWIVFIAVPLSWTTLLVGFVLFRFFDIIKPWPIRWLDRRVKGGFGIMIDDIIAGLFAWVLLQAALGLGWL